MNFTLHDNRIAVVPDEDNQTTASGLYVAESGQDPIRFGTITHVGTGRISEATGDQLPIPLNVGDRVFFGRHSGQPVTMDDTEYVIMSPQEVIGLVDHSLSVVDD